MAGRGDERGGSSLKGGRRDRVVLHLRYNLGMKSATLPAVRVDPELREQVEGVLAEGETLSEFVEAAVRDGVHRRVAQAEFVRRGLASLEAARTSGRYITADTALQTLENRLAAARVKRGKSTDPR